MLYQTFPPHALLKTFVRFYWLLELSGDEHESHRLLPGIGCDIIVQIGPPALYRIAGTGWQTRRPASFVEGHFRDYFQLRFPGACRLAGVRFSSTGLYPFVKTPLKEFTQRFVDVTAVFGAAGEDLLHQVVAMPNAQAWPGVCERFLLQQLRGKVESNVRAEAAAQILIQRKGLMPIHRLLDEIDMSERQLERAFERLVGISPERFAQRLRLNHFIRLARHAHRPSLTQLAFDCGYADQSHLIRAFRQHTGLAPRDYFHQRHAIQQALNC